jgi:signal transduction histidine kinase
MPAQSPVGSVERSSLFVRSATDRMVLGVAGGVARKYGFDAYLIRIGLLLLTLTGGLGVILYLTLWVLSSAASDKTVVAPVADRLASARSLAAAAATGALLLTARNLGVWPGDALMIPAVVVASGSALVWYRSRSEGSVTDPLERVLQGRATPLRSLAGGALAFAGVVALVARGVKLEQLPAALAAVAMALAGAAVLIGPYVGRLTAQVRDEERERIRDVERNAMAAHLHDSVLQTLALMQRATDDPRRVLMLARRQERELRSWLYDNRPGVAIGVLSARAEAIAAEVELDHGLPIDLVVVGDADLTASTESLLLAVREATVNAAKHSGAEQVSIYVEVEPNVVTAFVRDKGIGFDVETIGADRRGIELSILDRVARADGRCVLESAPGRGTEWELMVPR